MQEAGLTALLCNNALGGGTNRSPQHQLEPNLDQLSSCYHEVVYCESLEPKRLRNESNQS